MRSIWVVLICTLATVHLLLLLTCQPVQANLFKAFEKKFGKNKDKQVNEESATSSSAVEASSEPADLADRLAKLDNQTKGSQPRKSVRPRDGKSDEARLRQALNDVTRISGNYRSSGTTRNRQVMEPIVKAANPAPLPEEEEFEPEPERAVPRLSDFRRQFMQHTPAGTPAGAKPALKPRINYSDLRNKAPHPASKLLSGTAWKKGFGKALKTTKKGFKQMGKELAELPSMVSTMIDKTQAWVQLDNKGKVLALIYEADELLLNVRREFSSFSQTWSPLMQKALNYIGTTGLKKLKWDKRDEFDYRHDALVLACFCYEFMRYMSVWRDNMMIAYGAYKYYLESVREDITNPRDGQTPIIDEVFLEHCMQTKNYMLFRSWDLIQQDTSEELVKLNYLMEYADTIERDYERDYQRGINLIQEVYEPTSQNLEQESLKVAQEASDAQALGQDLVSLDEFYDVYKQMVAKGEIVINDFELPERLNAMMEDVRPELQYNPIVYPSKILLELEEAKRRILDQ